MKALSPLGLLLLFGCTSSVPSGSTALGGQLESEYVVEDVLITTRDGATLSGMFARKKGDQTPRPTILQFTIYVRDEGRDLEDITRLVDAGYVGFVAYTRGKRHSPEEIYPYEHDGRDAHDVIDWISKQPGSDGRVGMYGGSYNGFTQWASTKNLHPALKTIVPYVANRPGMGLPTENGIYVNPNYSWSLYVSNNKTLDTLVNNDRQRFRDMQNAWWQSGVAFSKMDSVDGTPNRLFQRWLEHPSYDAYWQEMTPYQEEFAQIDIPVLTFDGYYNDSQNSSLSYLREHYKYNPDAEHYLIIGPYSHLGAQRNGADAINGHRVDEHARIDTQQITYQWFEYVFQGAERPEILKDKINYQVMGADEWRSAPSLQAMSNTTLKLYLTTEESGDDFMLRPVPPPTSDFLYQQVDFSDRGAWHNNYYPDPIVRDYKDTGSGFNLISEPLEGPVLVNGSFLGELAVTINKRDFDFGVTLYEAKSDGTYFNLSYIIGRASYSRDISKRILLEPGKMENIPFSNTRLISKRLEKGSRLLVHINVNKNPFSDLNHGTGRRVSEETIADATEPLEVKWHNQSFVEIPLWNEPGN